MSMKRHTDYPLCIWHIITYLSANCSRTIPEYYEKFEILDVFGRNINRIYQAYTWTKVPRNVEEE